MIPERRVASIGAFARALGGNSQSSVGGSLDAVGRASLPRGAA